MPAEKAEMWREIARQIRRWKVYTSGDYFMFHNPSFAYWTIPAWFDSKKDALDFKRACIEYCKKRAREEEK